MSDIAQSLLQYANDIASGLGRRKAELDKELSDLKLQILTKQTQSDLAGSAIKRLLDFRPSGGGVYHCPDCWVSRGVDATLRSVGGGTSTADYFVCNTCNARWEIPI